MRNVIFVSCLAILCLMHCSKEKQETLTWQVGEILPGYGTKVNSNTGVLKFEMTNESFCIGSAHIEVLLTDDNNTLIHENVFEFPYSKEFSIKKGETIVVSTLVETKSIQDTVCVRLGNINCKMEY